MRACLLTLPLEVRLLTYSFLYHRDFLTLRPRNRLSDRPTELMPDDPLYVLALLSVSKQIRTEVSAILFDHITVNIAESEACHRDGSSYWEIWNCEHYEAQFPSTWRLPRLTHRIKHLAMHQHDVGNLDLAIVAGQFPALQQVIAWDDHWVTGMYDDDSLIVEPELSRAREDYIQDLKEDCFIHQVMARAPQAPAPSGFRLFVQFMKTDWEVWEVEILPDGSHTFTTHKLSAAMVPGHVMTERRVVVVG